MYSRFAAYKQSLEEAIQSDTSGHFCRILVSLVQVRPRLENVDRIEPPRPHAVWFRAEMFLFIFFLNFAKQTPALNTDFICIYKKEKADCTR